MRFSNIFILNLEKILGVAYSKFVFHYYQIKLIREVLSATKKAGIKKLIILGLCMKITESY